MFCSILFAVTLYCPFFSARANFVKGGFEAFGNIVAGAGWQRYRIKGTPTNIIPTDVNGAVPGVIGGYSNAIRINREDEFKFFLDQAELDLAKSFGENVRIRSDLDFGSNTLNSGPRFTNGAGGGAAVGIVVEQAYAVANFFGAEFLLGRFNAPIGFEKVDVIDNFTISRSAIYRSLRPNTLTGVKFYKAFSDAFDWHIYVVNSTLTYDHGDMTFQSTDVPGAGTRFGINWGDEGKKSTVGLSGIYGNDHPNGKTHVGFLGDVDWQWWITDSFSFGGEGIYRQVNTTSSTAGRRKNGKYYGALANFHYDLSDVFYLNFRYDYTNDINGPTNSGILVIPITSTTGTPTISLTGAKQQIHEAVLDGQYAIADNTYFRVEFGYSYMSPALLESQQVFGVAGIFAYAF